MLSTESPQHPVRQCHLPVPHLSIFVPGSSCCSPSASSSAFHLPTLSSYRIPVSSLLCHCSSPKASMSQAASFPTLHPKVTFTCISAPRLPAHPSLRYPTALGERRTLPRLSWCSCCCNGSQCLGSAVSRQFLLSFCSPTRHFPSKPSAGMLDALRSLQFTLLTVPTEVMGVWSFVVFFFIEFYFYCSLQCWPVLFWGVFFA